MLLRSIQYVFFCVLAMFLVSCGGGGSSSSTSSTSSNDTVISEIRALLNGIKKPSDGLPHAHSQFLHNGKSASQFFSDDKCTDHSTPTLSWSLSRVVTQTSDGQYTLDITVQFTCGTAVSTDSFDIPFKKENGVWTFYGNQNAFSAGITQQQQLTYTNGIASTGSNVGVNVWIDSNTAQAGDSYTIIKNPSSSGNTLFATETSLQSGCNGGTNPSTCFYWNQSGLTLDASDSYKVTRTRAGVKATVVIKPSITQTQVTLANLPTTEPTTSTLTITPTLTGFTRDQINHIDLDAWCGSNQTRISDNVFNADGTITVTFPTCASASDRRGFNLHVSSQTTSSKDNQNDIRVLWGTFTGGSSSSTNAPGTASTTIQGTATAGLTLKSLETNNGQFYDTVEWSSTFAASSVTVFVTTTDPATVAGGSSLPYVSNTLAQSVGNWNTATTWIPLTYTANQTTWAVIIESGNPAKWSYILLRSGTTL